VIKSKLIASNKRVSIKKVPQIEYSEYFLNLLSFSLWFTFSFRKTLKF